MAKGSSIGTTSLSITQKLRNSMNAMTESGGEDCQMVKECTLEIMETVI